MTDQSGHDHAGLISLMDKGSQFYDDLMKNNKPANILVFGKTGVGKSTLINTVFRDNLAETGVGRPVTQGIREITKSGVPLCILDSQGLELADFIKIKELLIAEVKNRRGIDEDRYIHLAWLCISDEGKRVEDAEIDLAKELTQAGLDVIVVLTKTRKFSNNEFKDEVEKQFKGVCREVIPTRAVDESEVDDEGNASVWQIKGINDLISSSYRYIPESQKRSFANALSLKNKKSLSIKRDEANTAITIAVAAAGGIALAPIPFSDAIGLVPVQVGMILGISNIFGMNVTKDSLMPILGGLLGSGMATVAGRLFVGSILKFIPGIGSIAGGAIGAAVAGELTRRLGVTYTDILVEIVERGAPLELDSAIDLLKEKLGL